MDRLIHRPRQQASVVDRLVSQDVSSVLVSVIRLVAVVTPVVVVGLVVLIRIIVVVVIAAEPKAIVFSHMPPTKSRIDLSVGKLANITFYLLTSPVLGPRDLVYRSRFHGPISLAGGVGSSMPHCMALPPKPLRNQKAQARPELLTIAEEVKTKLATSATGLANANCAGCATPWTEEGLSRSRRS